MDSRKKNDSAEEKKWISPKASLTSHHTCTYVLVTEKNRLICKGHLRYACDFITKYQGRTSPAMKIGTHISSVCTQYGYKLCCWENTPCLQVKSLLPGHFNIFQQYLQHTYVCIHIRQDVRVALDAYP